MSVSDPVGYRKPPHSTRFRKGKSGNPKGRPRGRKSQIPYDSVFSQNVTIRDNGIERTVTAAEAFLLYLFKSGLEGDSTAAKLTLEAIAMGQSSRGAGTGVALQRIIRTIIVSGESHEPVSVNEALQRLKMARKLDPYRPTAHMALELWIVEAALARFPEKRFTPGEKALIRRLTSMPHKIKWGSK